MPYEKLESYIRCLPSFFFCSEKFSLNKDRKGIKISLEYRMA